MLTLETLSTREDRTRSHGLLAAPVVSVPPRTFVTPEDLGLGDAARPMGGVRSRTPVPDVLRSAKLPGGTYVSMSALETAGLLGLLCDPGLVRVVPSAHVLAYPDGEGWGRFVPDAVALRRDRGVIAHAFRFTWQRVRPEWQATERKLRRAYREQGVAFSVLTETTLFAKAVRVNRLAMLRDHVVEGRRGDLDKVRDALDRIGFPATVGDVRRRGRFPAKDGLGRTLRCLHELALAGEVALDLDRPFDGGTRIRRGPLA